MTSFSSSIVMGYRGWASKAFVKVLEHRRDKVSPGALKYPLFSCLRGFRQGEKSYGRYVMASARRAPMYVYYYSGAKVLSSQMMSCMKDEA